MTITLFIKPESLAIFLEVCKILKDLPLENNYVFQPSDITFSEAMISNYIWLNIEVMEYLKLKYCIRSLTPISKL